jgi:hypothetical protein
MFYGTPVLGYVVAALWVAVKVESVVVAWWRVRGAAREESRIAAQAIDVCGDVFDRFGR